MHRLDTPTGRATRLKPGRLWVRIPLQAKSGMWLMVSRLPWEQDTTGFDSLILDCEIRPRGAARSARLFVTEKVAGSNPAEDASSELQIADFGLQIGMRHGTPTGRAAKLKPWIGVGSNPTRATQESRVRCQESGTWSGRVRKSWQSGHLERVVIVCGFDSHLDHWSVACERIWRK